MHRLGRGDGNPVHALSADDHLCATQRLREAFQLARKGSCVDGYADGEAHQGRPQPLNRFGEAREGHVGAEIAGAEVLGV